MECPVKHRLSYLERLRKKAWTQSNRIDIGSIVHMALEYALSAYYNTSYLITLDEVYAVVDDAIDSYDQEKKPKVLEFGELDGYHWDNQKEVDEWNETINTARGISKRTIRYLDVPNNWRTESITIDGKIVPLIEFSFEYPLVEDRNMIGRIDWVARNIKDGQIYLIDWKTRGKFTEAFAVGGENMNLQMSIYQYVLNSLGVDVFGTLTYQIKSTIPKQPDKTLKGRLSKSNITTDWETYRQAILDNGELEDDPYYEEMRIKLQIADFDQWWLPVTVIRSRKELESRWNTVKKIAKKMVEDTDPAKYESQRCMYCPFFSICLGEDNGEDVEFIKVNEYMSRDNNAA